MTYATPTDIARAYRGSTEVGATENVQWQEWLDIVERSIARRFKANGYDLATQVVAENPDIEDVIDVEVSAVIRKIQNPVWGRTSSTVNRQVDDASISHTDRIEGGGYSGDPLALLDTEWAALLPTKPRRARAFSIMPS